MKVIFNQKCIEENQLLVSYTENDYFSGDYVNGFCWLFQNKILYWECAYFQLMASMRKMRIDIPLSFTPELFESQIRILSKEWGISEGRIKITVYRNLQDHHPSFIIKFLSHKNFFVSTENEIDIYKEIFIYPNLLSELLIFHPINSIAKQYSKENGLQDVMLLNNEKRIARSVLGNIFLIRDNMIVTPPTTEGATLSVLKKNYIVFLREKTNYIYKEEPISPFEIQFADEFFILSDENGIMPINQFRKKSFKKDKTSLLTKKFIGYSLEQNPIYLI
ncbi:MAG: aminotransferase class IV [Apibacter sp.]|nr:aminotransferase class IV [Apibacter sp.]